MKVVQRIFLESLGCPDSVPSCGDSVGNKQELAGVGVFLRTLASDRQPRELQPKLVPFLSVNGLNDKTPTSAVRTKHITSYHVQVCGHIKGFNECRQRRQAGTQS